MARRCRSRPRKFRAVRRLAHSTPVPRSLPHQHRSDADRERRRTLGLRREHAMNRATPGMMAPANATECTAPWRIVSIGLADGNVAARRAFRKAADASDIRRTTASNGPGGPANIKPI